MSRNDTHKETRQNGQGARPNRMRMEVTRSIQGTWCRRKWDGARSQHAHYPRPLGSAGHPHTQPYEQTAKKHIYKTYLPMRRVPRIHVPQISTTLQEVQPVWNFTIYCTPLFPLKFMDAGNYLHASHRHLIPAYQIPNIVNTLQAHTSHSDVSLRCILSKLVQFGTTQPNLRPEDGLGARHLAGDSAKPIYVAYEKKKFGEL